MSEVEDNLAKRASAGPAERKLRVALYFYSLAGAGGAEKQLLALADWLSLRGHEVCLISLDPEGMRPFHPIPPGVIWQPLGWRRSLAGRWQRAKRIRHILRSEKIDVFVGFVMGGDKSIYIALAGMDTALVAAERNDPIIYSHAFGRWRRWVYWLLFGLCDRIVVQLSVYRKGYPAWLRSRIEAIGNPVDPGAIGEGRAGSRSVDNLSILNVGRLHWQKGQDLLLRAFAATQLAGQGWRVRIVGSGEAEDDLKQCACELGIEACVEFSEPTRQIAKEYSSADIFAFPSRYEGFPNALAEAMASGLPCVGFRTCVGTTALIEDDANGIVVQGTDEAQQIRGLADALCRLAANRQLRERLGTCAALDMGTYASNTVYGQWEQVLRAVVRN